MRRRLPLHARLALGLALAAPEVLGRPAAQPEPPPAAAPPPVARARAERKLEASARPVVGDRTKRAGSARLRDRLRARIPEALRASLERAVEARIERDLTRTRELRREALALLVALVGELPRDAAERPEALLRLGEVEWEEARDSFLAAFRAWEALPGELRADPPMPDYRAARTRFLEVLREHKTYRNYDLALYVDGFLATEMGLHDEALDRFQKILSWFPKSRFVPDAHMVRAEYEFVKEVPDYRAAYEEYEKVLAFPGSELHDLALFKSAWCLFRLGEPEESARRFLAVFKKSAEAGQGATAKRRAELGELQAEALRNLVAVFVEDEKNRAEDMHRFLQKAGGERFASEIVLALASALYDQAHYERGIEAYRFLLRLQPMSAEAFRHELAIARAQSTMQSWDALDAQYRAVLSRYVRPPRAGAAAAAVQPSAWVRGQPAAVLDGAAAEIEAQLRADAVGLLAKAQADRTSRAEYQAAARLYETYVSRFSGTKAAYEVEFNRGEIYFHHLGDDARAADAYLAAVRIDPRGPLSRDALVNALAALETSRARELESTKTTGGPARESETDRRLTEAMELYIRTYPEDPDVPEILFRQGRLYYDYRVFDAAVRQWGLLLERYPRSARAATAGELVLDSFNRSADYANIETWARRLKAAPAFQSAPQQARLDGLIVQAVFKQGEQLSAAGRHADSAAAYLRAAREFPREPRAAEAAVNAGLEARRGGDFDTLRASADLLVRDHASRPEAAQGLWTAATAYQSIGLFSESAAFHEAIAARYPRFEHHRDAAYDAVLLRTTAGEHDAAIRAGEAYRRLYPRAEDLDDVAFLMGKAHEKAERWKDAETVYLKYAEGGRAPSGRIEAWVRLATVRLRLGDARGAETALSSALGLHRQHRRTLEDQGKYWGAKARYMQGERLLAAFDQIAIQGDVAELKSRLRKKSELLKRAADAFLGTAELGVAEWTTAALYQIGVAYESFSRALLGSAPPESLGPEDREAYRQQIEEFVIPIEERSLEAYESGWQKAVELGIYNQWTAKMRAALARLNAELYPPLDEIGFDLRSRGPAPLPALIEAPRRGPDGRSLPYALPEPAPPSPARDKDTAPGRPEPAKGAAP